MTLPRLVLASASPRRKALLAAAGVVFDIVESGIDETREAYVGAHQDATSYAERMARAKARSVSQRMPDALVLGADTVVELRGTVLLKPADVADARKMLRALSGQTHTVATAIALARGGWLVESSSITARVTFRRLADYEIEAYLATGEPLDKAGGYGIQGASAGFIAALAGGRDTVMGLPVDAVLAALRRYGSDAG